MSTQPLDYASILADLEAKKSAIEAAIASLRSAIALGAVSQTGEMQGMANGIATAIGTITASGDVPDGAFLGKGIPEATKLLLEIVKKKLTTREIADALKRGGLESTSSNFVGIVHAVLNRARKSPNSPFVKLGSHWGLKDWYPKGIVSAATPSRGKKAKKKNSKTSEKAASAKPSAQSSVKTAKETNPQAVPISGSITEKIALLLRSKPGTEFSADEITTHFGIGKQVAYMLLGKLTSKGQTEKTASGKYRTPVAVAAAV